MITLKNLRARCALHGSCQHVVQKKKLTQQLARSRLAQLWIGAADGEHDFDSICGSHTCGCRTHVRQIGRRSTALEGTLGIESNPSRGDCNYLFFFGRVVMIQHISIKTEFIFAAGHYEMPRHGSQRRTCEGAWSPRNQVHDQGHCSLCGGYAIKEKFCIVDV